MFDVTGREVATLFNGEMNAGTNSVVWNGRDNDGNQVGSGMYLCRLFAGSSVQTMKMLYTK